MSENAILSPRTIRTRAGRQRRTPEPPDRLPRFSILGVMLLTVAIAVVIGALKASPQAAPLVALLILVVWGVIGVARSESKSNLLICELWSGIVLPLTMASIMLNSEHLSNRPNFLASLAFWLAPFLVWNVVRYFRLPRISAMLAGCLAATSAFGIGGITSAFGVEVGSGLASMLFTFAAIVAIIIAGLFAAVAHFIAMREAWIHSYQNRQATLVAIASPFLVIALVDIVAKYIFH